MVNGSVNSSMNSPTVGDDSPPGDFAATLRAAVADRGLTLERVRYHLKQSGHELSVATLSYWQSGRSRPDRASSLAALGSLEEILQVPRGSLAALLPARMRLPRLALTTYPVRSLFDTGQLIEQGVADLGISWNDLERISTHDVLALQADRSVGSHVVRVVMRAARDGVDRFVTFYGDDPTGTPYVMARENCWLGRVLEYPDRGLVIAEMLLNQPLAMGDVVLVEYEFAVAGSHAPCDHWERACPQQHREVFIEVAFHESALPTEVRSGVNQGGVQRHEPATLNGNQLSLLQLDFGPGVVGLCWSW